MSWRMMTSSNGNIFRVTGPLCGEFTGPGEFPTQMPVTRSFDVSFDLRLNKRVSKQPWGWWFETPSWSLLRQCNGTLLAVVWLFSRFRFMIYAFIHNHHHFGTSLRTNYIIQWNIFRLVCPLWGHCLCNGWFPLTKGSNSGLWFFLWCMPDQTVEQTVIWDAMKPMWRHCNIQWILNEHIY